ncbi:DUF4129 domain-containing protein [Planosporangium mesophilum]|uniref:Protein-glutamine gamma-glutamyltransferase-like C-terminal domain-containing protein n=1 Tax=Planosporangium mesophilum TaxID=689768 RepID=A0A8J3X0N6_9ACTN|nr:DUF4129 domain-containing protein [Planosporangium mesophilum]NJC84960.1 DUF4129 domain-containing protein [Planosporangium mesophilum]GII23570.1 hypothetical protein Pme01_31670 [Planosporangium mesophilum]
MSRWWTDRVAAVSDVVPLPLLVLLLLAVAVIVGVAWYRFPAWVPRRLPRLPRLRRRGRKRADGAVPATQSQPADGTGLPDLPAAEFASLADRLAAEERYAEAIRERLREMVRQLIERGVIEHRPGWTVTELAGAAGAALPAVAGPLAEAAGVFSDTWYGQRPALAATDARMRALADTVRQAIQWPAAPGHAG